MVVNQKHVDKPEQVNIVLLRTMFKKYFSAREAARICGFETVYMLDYLQRSGVYVPRDRPNGGRKGRNRRYNFRDLMVLKTISVLLQNGASVSALKKSLIEFQSSKWIADKASLELNGNPVRYFIASSKSIVFATSNDRIYELNKGGQMLFNFVIDLDQIHSDLRFSIDQGSLPLSLPA